jgi:hypothetical protein
MRLGRRSGVTRDIDVLYDERAAVASGVEQKTSWTDDRVVA